MAHKALKEVQLVNEKDTITKLLPLGMKRRLSIAISLVADPKIVFLDEPTTGLDPETRRQLWNILQDVRSDKKRAMVLTTHSMEEADVLCNRIGIVSNGVLRCIGNQVRLKHLYGGGYHLFVNCQKAKFLKAKYEKKRQAELRRAGYRGDGVTSYVGDANDSSDEDLASSVNNGDLQFLSLVKENSLTQSRNISLAATSDFGDMLDGSGMFLNIEKVQQTVMDFILKLLPQAILLREFNGNFVYQIPIEGFNAERLFVEMEKNKEKLRIADWGIS